MMNKTYWEHRYKNNDTAWDVGTITPPLKTYIDQLTDTSIKILIPGAGNGYEFDYFIHKGFFQTFVMDVAQQPIENIKARNPNFVNRCLVDDFFNCNDTFDLVIEQTFFCAIETEMRAKYVQKMHEIIKPNGKLVGLLFDFPLTEIGPPFGGSYEEYLTLFKPLFTIKILEKSYNSIKPREGKEFFITLIPKK